MPAAPAASCALGIGRKHTSKRVHRNHPAFPHAMVLTVSFALSPVTGLVCHRRSADMFLSKPGWADLNSANLTPASGRQDHTTSPSAATSLVRTLSDRSQAFRPALRSHRAQNAAASTATIVIQPASRSRRWLWYLAEVAQLERLGARSEWTWLTIGLRLWVGGDKLRLTTDITTEVRHARYY
jgi:hypothetical protein